MMQNININEKEETENGWILDVEIEENGAMTSHTVTVKKDDLKRLAPKQTPMELVWASFLFLLERESKESILREFDLMLITKYFPEYEKEIKNYL